MSQSVANHAAHNMGTILHCG